MFWSTPSADIQYPNSPTHLSFRTCLKLGKLCTILEMLFNSNSYSTHDLTSRCGQVPKSHTTNTWTESQHRSRCLISVPRAWAIDRNSCSLLPHITKLCWVNVTGLAAGRLPLGSGQHSWNVNLNGQKSISLSLETIPTPVVCKWENHLGTHGTLFLFFPQDAEVMACRIWPFGKEIAYSWK